MLTGAAGRADNYQTEGDFRATLPRFQGENFERNLALAGTL